MSVLWKSTNNLFWWKLPGRPLCELFPLFCGFFMFWDVFWHYLEKYNRYRESERSKNVQHAMLYKKVNRAEIAGSTLMGVISPFFVNFSCFWMFFDIFLKSIIDREKMKEAKLFSTPRSTKKSKSRNCCIQLFSNSWYQSKLIYTLPGQKVNGHQHLKVSQYILN